MHQGTKGAAVDHRVRELSRYKQELVRDLAYGKVRLPAGWLAPGDATIIALDAPALLDDDQSGRCQVLLDRCGRLVDQIERLIGRFIAAELAAGGTFTKNELDSLRRGRGPNRVRDLLFQRLPGWPEGEVPALPPDEVALVLGKSLRDRKLHQAAADRDPLELRALVEPLLAEVQKLVSDWAAVKGLRREAADYVVSEVLDQLIRTVAEQNRAPENLVAWSRSTAKWKWLAGHTGRPEFELDRDLGIPGTDDVGEQASRRVDLHRRLRAVAGLMLERSRWYAQQAPPRPDDALTYLAAAQLLDTGDVELLEAVVRGTPDGLAAVRAQLGRPQQPLSADRELAVIRLTRDSLRRYLDDEG